MEVIGHLFIELAIPNPKIIDGYWHEWREGVWVNTGEKATGADGSNYVHLGFWDNTVQYSKTELGIPVVRIEASTSAGFTSWVLQVEHSTTGSKPSVSNSEWELVESVSYMDMLQAYIGNLQFNAADGGGFFIKDNRFWSKWGTVNGVQKMYEGESNFEPNLVLAGLLGEIIARSGLFEKITVKDSHLENVAIRGSLRAPFSAVDGYVIDTSTGQISTTLVTDNLMLKGGDGWVNSLSLDWTTAQSGRRVFATLSKWGTAESAGKAKIDAPSGKYFFWNGKQLSSLTLMSGEFFELIGYGTETVFHGWIVVNRSNLRTAYSYGTPLKVLAQGTVTHNGTGTPSIKAIAFDGSTLTTSRIQQGRYRVNFPSSWFEAASDYLVMLSPVGYAADNATGPIKATLTSAQMGFFIVDTSDDATRNDGSFSFQITNLKDWDYT